MQRDCSLAVVTTGPEGCLVVTPDGVMREPAEPVEQVLDTTGAGDLFAAGFLFGYTRAMSLGECARLGSIAAAEVISHVGPRPLVALKIPRPLILITASTETTMTAHPVDPRTTAERWLAAEPDDDMRDELERLLAGSAERPGARGSPVGCSSARPACAARSAPGRSG